MNPVRNFCGALYLKQKTMKLFLTTISNGVIIKKNTKKILPALLFSLLFLLPITASAIGTYTPMEQLPGYGAPTDFFDYVAALYKFGIGAVGIAAMIMVTIGGFMYISSAGNNASMEKAKGVITDAIVGLLLALSAYIILYTINPDLVKLKKPTVTPITLPAGPAAVVPPGVPPPGGAPGVPAPGAVPLVASRLCAGGRCSLADPYIQSNAYGVDPAILKSLIDGGEGCNPGISSAGACGYTQLMPANRSWCGIAGTAAQTCQAVQNDTQLAINCASRLLSKDMIPRCGADMNQIASCYNTGRPNNCANAQNNYCGRVSTYYASCT